MLNPSPAKEKAYKKFKGGDGNALFELLEGERAELYDYLMRIDRTDQPVDGDDRRSLRGADGGNARGGD